MAHVNGGQANGSFGATPSVVTIPFTPTTGNTLLISCFMSNGAAITGVTDSAGNTWTLDATLNGTYFFRLNAVGASVPATISVAFSGGGSGLARVYFEEASGLSGATIDDSDTVVTAFGLSHSISVTTTVANAHAFGALGFNGGGAPNIENLVSIGGATPLIASGAAPAGAVGWYNADLGAAGSKSLGFSWDSANGSGMTCNLHVVVYAPAAAGGSVVTRSADDAVAVTDAAVGTALRGRVASDAVAVTDSYLSWFRRVRDAIDTIVVTDGDLERSVLYQIVATDLVEIADQALRQIMRQRLMTDAIEMSDSLLSATSSASVITKLIEDIIVVGSQLLSSTERHRDATSLIALNDELLRIMLYVRMVESTTDVFDEVSKLVAGVVLNNPIVLIGVDTPRIELGGYRV